MVLASGRRYGCGGAAEWSRVSQCFPFCGGEGGDGVVQVVLRFAAPSSCGPAIPEAKDFPSAVYNAMPTQGEFGDVEAESRRWM